MRTRYTASLLLACSAFAAQAQCSVDLPADTVTLYWGYDPMACATLTPVVVGAQPTQLLWSNGSNAAAIEVCDTQSGWYSVTLTDDTLCTATDSVFVEVVDVRCGNGNNKVLVCHVPPGNPANAHTICISENGVPAHLAHGCHLGACAAQVDSSDTGELQMQVTPNPMDRQATVTVTSGVEQRVRVRVLDPMGRQLLLLLDAEVAAGASRTLPLNNELFPTGLTLVMVEAQGDTQRLSRAIVLQH